MRYLLSCIALSLLVWCSCSSMKKQSQSGAKNSDPLAGTSWTLSAIPGFEAEKTPKPVTISFQDSLRFSGNGGCNGYGGAYTLEGSSLKLGRVLSTKMACMPGMKTENKLFELYTQVDHYRVSGDKLNLMQGEKVLAEFGRSKKDQK